VPRVPPHDLDAERAVIGALIIDADATMPLVVDALKPEHFFLDAHRILYAQGVSLHDDGVGLNLQTMQDALAESGELAAIGGPQTLALAVEAGAMAIPTVIPRLVEIIRRHAARRSAIQACLTAISSLSGPVSGGGESTRPVREVAAELSDVLSSLADESDPERSGRADEPIGVIAERLMADIMLSLHDDFVSYPIATMNRLLGGGSKPGELVYLGAGFGTGKTGIALEWAAYVAQHGKRVLVVTAEMTKAAVTGRVISQQGMVGAQSFRSGRFEDDEQSRADATARSLRDLPIIIDDEATTLGAIRRLVRRHHPDLLIIDYLQLISSPAKPDPTNQARSEKRHEIDAVSRGLKRIAKRHRCVVLSLSQLTLIPDGKGKFQRPSSASLKESRGPSEDADTILLLWRPDPVKFELELIVAKGRNHQTGSIKLEFTPHYLWFRERE
jgi:replicative DNA helicase